MDGKRFWDELIVKEKLKRNISVSCMNEADKIIENCITIEEICHNIYNGWFNNLNGLTL